jgi:two-component system nitrogen regulation response regulator NtrX
MVKTLYRTGNRMHSKLKVLVVDDDQFVCEDIATSLDKTRFEVDKAHDLESAIRLHQKHCHAIVVTDLHMKNGPNDGLLLLERVKQESERTAVMILSGYNDVQKVVKAMRLGAADFLTKPYETDQIALKIEKLADRVSLLDDNARLKKEISSQSDIVGVSPSITALKRKISIVARTESRVLITGPNGSGKELVALAIRAQSTRAGKAFVALNCGAIPESLFEGELFGSDRGAYTNAPERKGKFEMANGGLLFLDEVGEMSPANQVKLLRALESNEITRLGGERPITVNVRVLAATNKNLPDMIQAGKFREDLFYRLNVVSLETTPLRSRPEDVPVLIDHLLNRMGRPQKAEMIFTPRALVMLQSHEWPGNVRELSNVVERLLIFWDGTPITPEQVYGNILSPSTANGQPDDRDRTLKDATASFEAEFIRKAFRASGGNMTQAAQKLGLQRPYLYEKMKSLGIDIHR